MKTLNCKVLTPQMKQEVLNTLIFDGKIRAIKAYRQYVDCSLREAKNMIEKMGKMIQPGQATGA